MKTNDYLVQHYPTAVKEHHCIVDCTYEALNQVRDGELDAAESLLRDAQKSIATLRKLKKEKQTNDAMKELVSNLQTLGFDAEIMTRKFGGMDT